LLKKQNKNYSIDNVIDFIYKNFNIKEVDDATFSKESDFRNSNYKDSVFQNIEQFRKIAKLLMINKKLLGFEKFVFFFNIFDDLFCELLKIREDKTSSLEKLREGIEDEIFRRKTRDSSI